MTSYKKALLFSAFLLMALPACSGTATDTPVEDATSVEDAAPEASATPEPEEPTKRPTNTPPQVGPMATAAALAAQTTLVPPTPYGGEGASIIESDDYVGIFEQAWNTVKSNYVRDNFNGVDWEAVHDEYLPLAEAVTSSEGLWELLDDLIGELDDHHSRFVSPLELGAEYGISTSSDAEPRKWSGVYLWSLAAREDEHVFVWCVSPNGPGERAGIERGDHILAVDGVSFERTDEGYDRDMLRSVLYGTGGDSVTLTVQRGPDLAPEDITLDLEFASGCDGWDYKIISESPRIGYIRILNFGGDSDTNIMNAIEAMEEAAPLDALILDERHNPGGNSDADAAIFTAGVVGTVGPLREDATRTIYRIRGVDWNETTPVVVLTDGNSHSAADYFAASMQFLGRATMVGMHSAGNTEGINAFPLADGSQVRLAWTTLVLDDGTILEGVGVVPDIMVPMGDWGMKQTPFDVQMQAALDFLLDLLGG